ncbi:hypothetical protein [Paludisphaera rhizosphaerae]|nr:hypothetical protein [Paludisphaera rhizosphaerae]
MSTVLKGFIRNGKVELNEPADWPDGTEVVVAQEDAGREEGPAPPDEIARVLAAMQRLQPLDIPDDVGADLDEWESRSTVRSHHPIWTTKPPPDDRGRGFAG